MHWEYNLQRAREERARAATVRPEDREHHLALAAMFEQRVLGLETMDTQHHGAGAGHS
jgi:hypothetical protein